MTICIAAICDDEKSIVTASDKSLTTGDFSADDLVLKTEWVDQNWHALFSANDITSCLPILREARARFQGRENTIEQIMASLKESYRNQLQNRITEEILGRYGLDLTSFRQNGLKQLGREVFNSICRQIERVEFDCDFLVCGFDQHETPHIFTVYSPGLTKEYSKPGFWAIGSGATSALSVMFFHGFNVYTPLPQAIYHVCEAKFMAESATGVGSATFVFVVHPSQNVEAIDQQLIEEIKTAWKKEGKAKIPQNIIATIESKLSGSQK